MIVYRRHKLIKRENTYKKGFTQTVTVLIITYWVLFIPVYTLEIIKE